MKIAIMQPYFYPYIGYFQLIANVDKFVIYDEIQYVKQSWINRNRILVSGEPMYISLPLKKDSDYLNVNQRSLADTWPSDRKKLLQKLSGVYAKAPFFNETFGLVETTLKFADTNLFAFLFHNLQAVLKRLSVSVPIVKSSELGIDPTLKAADKVIAICHSLKATDYVNPIGGLELYNKSDFAAQGISLSFLKTDAKPYNQFGNAFVPYLSIIDVLMFNTVASIQTSLYSEYSLV